MQAFVKLWVFPKYRVLLCYINTTIIIILLVPSLNVYRCVADWLFRSYYVRVQNSSSVLTSVILSLLINSKVYVIDSPPPSPSPSPFLSFSFRFLDRYLKAADTVKSHLIGYSKPSSLPYLGAKSGSFHGYLQSTMEHLACFYPGLLALGLINNLHPEQSSLAEGLTQACYTAYNSTATGLAADSFLFNTSPNGKSDYARASVSSYL